jgi:FixJ family two-component response regulator
LHIQECMRNGATEYFVKPHNMRDLIDLAKKMLDYCKNPVS